MKTKTFVPFSIFIKANIHRESLHGANIFHEHLRHDKGNCADIATGNVPPLPELDPNTQNNQS